MHGLTAKGLFYVPVPVLADHAHAL
eukprot:COSAG04_NODE_13306_length_612_cov_0.779727_1_plen_24_part_10